MSVGYIKKNQEFRKRKELGAFYTPSELSLPLTKAAIDYCLLTKINLQCNKEYSSMENIISSKSPYEIRQLLKFLKSIKILDGATGDGEFLRNSLNYLKYLQNLINEILMLSKDNNSHIVLKNIYGMEIDKASLLQCRKNLQNNYKMQIYSSYAKILERNIINGDFLKADVSNWGLEGSKFFDIILGNPPWGAKLSKDQKDYFHAKFELKSPKRNLNTFSLFLYQATQLLQKDSGILAFILPKNIARSNQYTHLRKYILENFQILEINFHGLFKGVTQEFISLIGLYKSFNRLNTLIHVNDKLEIPQSVYLNNIDYVFNFNYNKKAQKILEMITKETKCINDFFIIHRGEELSKKGGLMYCYNCKNWVPLSSRKKIVECSQCSQNLNKEDLMVKYIIRKTKDHEYSQEILTGDDIQPYRIIGTHYIIPDLEFKLKKNTKIYDSPKLVMQKIKRVPCIALDFRSRWTTQNVYNLRLKPQFSQRPELLYFFLAVLNSSLFSWFYETQFNLGSRFTNAISIFNLKRIPVLVPRKENPIYESIIKQTKLMHGSEEVQKDDIKKIDQLILQLYHCSEYLNYIENTISFREITF